MQTIRKDGYLSSSFFSSVMSGRMVQYVPLQRILYGVLSNCINEADCNLFSVQLHHVIPSVEKSQKKNEPLIDP